MYWDSVHIKVLKNSSNVFREIGRPFRNFYEHLKSKDSLVLSSHSTSPNNSQWLSMVLLGLFLLFFLWLVLAYFKATQRPSIAGKSTNYNVLCSGLTNKDRVSNFWYIELGQFF